MNYSNKVVVVTGAGGGVGRELVLQLLEKGASVAAVDINTEALEKTRESAGPLAGKVSIHTADITSQERVARLPGEVLEAHGTVDGLINNAGIIQPFITAADMDMNTIKRIMDINFYGMMYMTRAFLPRLAQAPEAFVGNVSSMGGFLPVPGQSIYGASKAAVKIATEGMRMELSRTNIKVSLILPGGMETDIKKNSGLKEEEKSREEQKKSAGVSLTQPDAAARSILKGLEKGKAKILIGKDTVAMDILYRLMPLKAGKMISKVMADNHGGIFNKKEDLAGIRPASCAS